MLYAMQAAARVGLRFFVLDRPNPIGGEFVEGPSVRPGFASFVGVHPTPIRHGMTVGELALLFRAELAIDVDLEVVECSGWTRPMPWSETGLAWVMPSPNMPTPETRPGLPWRLPDRRDQPVRRARDDPPVRALGSPLDRPHRPQGGRDLVPRARSSDPPHSGRRFTSTAARPVSVSSLTSRTSNGSVPSAASPPCSPRPGVRTQAASPGGPSLTNSCPTRSPSTSSSARLANAS